MSAFLTMTIILALGAAILAAASSLQQPKRVPVRPAAKPNVLLPHNNQPLKRQAVSMPAPARVTALTPITPKITPVLKLAAVPLSGMGGDLVAITGFADKGYLVLPPTPIAAAGVRRRVDELTTGKRFRGGMTNLAAGLDVALPLLEKAKPDRIKKLVIVSDGEPNEQLNRLPLLAERARKANVRICGIHVGESGSGSEVKKLTEATSGGWYTEACTVASLADAIRKAAADTQANCSSRKAVVVFAVDGSSSMIQSIDASGTSRNEALRRAIQDYLTVHTSNYGKH